MKQMKLAISEDDFKKISELADIIWREHYITIISEAQIDYMLDAFNSPEAIKSQINQGTLFYIINYQDIPIGYVAVKKETDFLFLSKLYVLSGYRGKKIGKAAMQHVNDLAQSFKLKAIRLNVNRYNTNSILAYEKLGFVKTKSIITEIGNGYIMDDYQMEKAT
jgi:diamine N-acetyltransferase